MEKFVDTLLGSLNEGDVDGALGLFAPGAVIDDVSVGEAFVGTDGIRQYFDRFFVGYHTTSRRLSLTQLDDVTVIVRVGFTGDFGHEIGALRIRKGAAGLIEHIAASLE